MDQAESAPTFNLKAVVKETGLKPDTLRAWERRYGLPAPGRSPGRHRLYSQRDIDTLKWLAARKKEGLTISRAVKLWRQLEAEGEDPLTAMPLKPSSTPSIAATIEGETIAEFRARWLQACLACDEMQADRILAQAHALWPPEVVVLNIIRQGIARIGEGGRAGQWSVLQERFATELALRRLETLIAATPPAQHPGVIVVGCPPQETHILSGLVITFLLRRRGRAALFLGADIPQEGFAPALAQIAPHLVILTAQQLTTAATLAEMAATLNDSNIPVAFGGLVFSRNADLRNHIPGYYLGDELEDAVASVEMLLNAPLRPLRAPDLSSTYQQALARFTACQLELRTRLHQLLAEAPVTFPAHHLAQLDNDVEQHIRAALKLGDIDLLNDSMFGMREQLYHRRLPAPLIESYFDAYTFAATECLGDAGEPIISWLKSAHFHTNNQE